MITTRDLVGNILSITKRLDAIEPVLQGHAETMPVLVSNDQYLNEKIEAQENNEISNALAEQVKAQAVEIDALARLVMRLEAHLEELAAKIER